MQTNSSKIALHPLEFKPLTTGFAGTEPPREYYTASPAAVVDTSENPAPCPLKTLSSTFGTSPSWTIGIGIAVLIVVIIIMHMLLRK